MWAREFERVRLHLANLSSELEKTTFVREYTGSLIAIGRPDAHANREFSSISFESLDLAEIYPALKSHALPAECRVTSLFYLKILRDLGFKGYQYSFGLTEEPYKQFIHSIGLIEIEFQGSRRLIVQDPYWNLTYRDIRGNPMDFFEFLRTIKDRHYEHIAMDASSVMTSLVITDPSVYFPPLSEVCQTVMTRAFAGSDGSRKTEIPIA